MKWSQDAQIHSIDCRAQHQLSRCSCSLYQNPAKSICFPWHRVVQSISVFPMSRDTRIHAEPLLLNSDRLRKIAREVDIQAFRNREPVRHQLQGNDVEETLKNVGSLRDFDTLGLVGRELVFSRVADDNRSPRSCDNYGTLVESDEERVGNIPCW
jgi:hypothetical protein